MATRLSGNRYAALTSDLSHLADDSVVAFAFYNVGIHDNELQGAKFKKKEKREKLKTDTMLQFVCHTNVTGMQCRFTLCWDVLTST